MELIEPQRRTAFVTFYSFKGGVGRTMALANTAAILAGRNRRVLMIDFDLEAPGLTYLGRQLEPAAEPSAGLVELITEFLEDPDASALGDPSGERLLSRFVQPLSVPKWTSKLEGGYLQLIPCGRLDDTYSSRLNQLDFNQLYQQGIGLPLFQLLKKVIRDSDRYDYVFVDSRTGFSDEAGICSRDLADHNVILSGLNRQNVRGTASFLKRLNASGWKGSVQFVATPVPVGYEDLRDERLEEARSAYAEAGYKLDGLLRIPYHPRLALDEDPFLYPWSNTDLGEAYERLQRRIREFANDRPGDWTRLALTELKEGRADEALQRIRELWVEDASAADSLLEIITQSGITEIRDSESVYPRLFELRIELMPRARAHHDYARWLIQQQQWDAARDQLSTARALAEGTGDAGETASVSISFGLLHGEQQRHREARNEFEAAAKQYRLVGDEAGAASALCNWGVALSKLAQAQQGAERERLFQEAIQQYSAAVAVKPDDHQALSNWGSALLHLVALQSGAERIHLLEEAREVLVRAEQHQAGSGAYNLACVAALSGSPDVCREWLSKARVAATLPSPEHLLQDNDLNSVQHLEWFQEFLLPDSNGESVSS